MGALVMRTVLVVRPDVVESFRELSGEWAARTRVEAGTLGFHVFLDDGALRAIFLEHYADSGSFVAHATAVDPALRSALYETCSVESFEIYGEPSDEVREMVARARPAVFGPVASR